MYEVMRKLMTVASAKSMLAVIATCPTRLIQPVNQLQAGALLLASFADQ